MKTTLSNLYALHTEGRLQNTDPRWVDVADRLDEIANWSVDKHVRGLFGTTRDMIKTEVGGRLIQKFVQRKFDFNGTAIETLIGLAARNEIMSYLRASKSVTAQTFDRAESRMERDDREPDQEDLFERARAAMGPFRFPEFDLLREAMLAIFLSKRHYPGQPFLNYFGVHPSVRRCVYNAAVFDCNRAMIAICEDTSAS